LEIDLSQSGLRLVFKDYMEEAMNLLWGEVEYQGKARENNGLEFSSREVWTHINNTIETRESISRASVINFLNAMCTDGFLDYSEITGKGGHRRIYRAKITKASFWDKVIAMTVKKLAEASGKQFLGLSLSDAHAPLEKIVA
jgi:hypothetical protein